MMYDQSTHAPTARVVTAKAADKQHEKISVGRPEGHCAVIFSILIALHLSSCHPPTRHVPGPGSESIRTNGSLAGSECVTVAHQGTYPILHTRMKRSRSGEVSLSPQSAPPSYTRPDNGTETNTTLSNEQHPQSIYSRIPVLENIITPIFRTVILILTLFNVNITWRIHALHVGRRPVRHQNQPVVRGWPV